MQKEVKVRCIVISEFFFFIVLLLFSGTLAFSQKTVISGKVTDAETGDAIPYVNIGFQHSLVGTISETDGSFYLSTTKASDTLLISSVGYEMLRLPIIKGKEQVFDVKLKPMSIALEAIIVKPGENPAFRILKKINEHKKQNDPARLTSYQYNAYTKLRLDLNNVGDELKQKVDYEGFRFCVRIHGFIGGV